jgi:hypothetical protein
LDQVIVRTYKAKSQSKAAKGFSRDAAKLARKGYMPIAQSWEQGKSGVLRFAITLGLSAWVLKPAGSLTVTYRLEPAQTTATTQP